MYSKLRGYIFIITILSIILLTRIFLLEFYKVTSASMERTIISGNWIIASKISYGPRLPRNLDEVPFGIFFKVLFNIKNKKKWDNANYTRFPGLTKVRRNDILLFRNPSNLTESFIKRCVGMPGDSIAFTQDSIFHKNWLETEWPCKNVTTGRSQKRRSYSYVPKKGDFFYLTLRSINKQSS